MSVAVFSADALLARILLLEAKRCGFEESSPENARVWLIDFDHAVARPTRVAPPTMIGFSSDPESVDAPLAKSLYALLPLPFSAKEFSAVLGRQVLAPATALLREGEELFLSGNKLHFSKTERAVLALLYTNRHRTVSTEELATIIGTAAANSNATAVYLYRLRRKLEADGRMRIRTVRGKGYRWMGE
jgi:hypothetical protein